MKLSNRLIMLKPRSVLIHCCCAHCAAFTIKHWQDSGYHVGVYWYNPNIHPYAEHQLRLEAMQSLTRGMGLSLIMAEGYDFMEYFRRVAGQESERCRHCFTMRLCQTAGVARQAGFGAFTTTLLISPHQKHDLIREVGQATAAASGIDFAYADLRKRYSESRHITKPLELYRQQYCGCLYSEAERYSQDIPV